MIVCSSFPEKVVLASRLINHPERIKVISKYLIILAVTKKKSNFKIWYAGNITVCSKCGEQSIKFEESAFPSF
jgi:hypothetical protein